MRSLFIKFLHTFLLFFLVFCVTAQNTPTEEPPITELGTISNDGSVSPNKYHVCLDENDQIVFKVNVVLGNLPMQNGQGYLPSFYEDMYVEFEVEGELGYTQVGSFDPVTLDNGVTAFSCIVESPPFDFSDECADNEDGIIMTFLSYRLVTPGELDEYVTYPACNYQSSLFTCLVYSYAPWCASSPIANDLEIPGDPIVTCKDEWFAGGYPVWLYCDCPTDDKPYEPYEDYREGGDSGIDPFDGGNDSSTRFVLQTNVNVYPNPMGEQLNIHSQNGSIRNVELYNAKGELVIKNTYTSDEIYDVYLNTSELSEGLYITRIVTEFGSKMVKVLK